MVLVVLSDFWYLGKKSPILKGEVGELPLQKITFHLGCISGVLDAIPSAKLKSIEIFFGCPIFLDASAYNTRLADGKVRHLFFRLLQNKPKTFPKTAFFQVVRDY